MLFFDGSRQHDDLAPPVRDERESALCRANTGYRLERGAKPPDFDA